LGVTGAALGGATASVIGGAFGAFEPPLAPSDPGTAAGGSDERSISSAAVTVESFGGFE
jgi:hypothetical protein